MITPAIRALEALRTRCQQDEKRAEETLATALRALEAAQTALRFAEAAEGQALAACETAREQTRQLRGSVQQFTEAAAYVRGLRADLALARDRSASARQDVARRDVALTAARTALAEARGKREAVDKRIAADRLVLERKAEARIEDDVADRAATRRN